MDIKHGQHHTLFLTKMGNVYCTGSNDSGQCGLDSSYSEVRDIVKVEFVNNDKIISISCGKLHSLFINERHELLVCGYNYCGQCGYNQNEDILEEKKKEIMIMMKRKKKKKMLME